MSSFQVSPYTLHCGSPAALLRLGENCRDVEAIRAFSEEVLQMLT